MIDHKNYCHRNSYTCVLHNSSLNLEYSKGKIFFRVKWVTVPCNYHESWECSTFFLFKKHQNFAFQSNSQQLLLYTRTHTQTQMYIQRLLYTLLHNSYFLTQIIHQFLHIDLELILTDIRLIFHSYRNQSYYFQYEWAEWFLYERKISLTWADVNFIDKFEHVSSCCVQKSG